MSVKRTLDLKGLKCPLPALLTRRALARAQCGEEIEVFCDDPFCHADVPLMCRNENFDVISVERDGDIARMILRKP